MWLSPPGMSNASVVNSELTLGIRRHANAESDGPAREWVAKTTKYIRETNTEKTGTKLATSTNFSLGPTYDSVEEVFGENLGRLKKIKAKYDPSKVWSKGWVIEPEL